MNISQLYCILSDKFSLVEQNVLIYIYIYIKLLQTFLNP